MKYLFLFFLPSSLCFHMARSQEAAEPDTIYQLSPVTVTATQAVPRLTPVTFSDLGKEELRERYSVQDIPVLLSDLPSMTTYSEGGNGIGYNYINLRGFDQRRLSIMVNGIPQNDPEDHNVYWIDLPDLLASTGSIQVQRGAGNAFYGPPAIGGSINLVTNPFDREPGVQFESMFGFQEFGDSSGSFLLSTEKYSASVQSGLIDNRYMLYGRLSTIRSDGYRQNSWVDYDSYFLGAVRVDETMTTKFHFFGGPISDGLVYYGLPKFVNENRTLRRQNLTYWETDSTNRQYTVTAPRRPQEIENFSQPHYELLHDWQISESVMLHNTLFYYTGDGFFNYDASWADTSMLRLGYSYGIPTDRNPVNTLVQAYVGNRQWGWLPRADISHEGGTLTVGAELRRHRSTHWGKINFAEDLPPDYDPDYTFYEYNGEKDIVSLFAHELFHPADDLTLMADLQLVYNRYGIRNEKYLGNSFDIRYWFLNPRAGINYNVSDRTNMYLSVGYTSREPRLRNLYAAEDSWFGATPQFAADTTGGVIRYDFSDPLVTPERLLNVEVGGSYRAGAVTVNLNLYWMEFTDELVKSGQVDIFGQPVTGNADRTRHIGLELDGAIDLPGNLTLSGNMTLSRNRLISYRIINDTGSPVTLDGNPIAGFPDFLANLRLRHSAGPVSTSVLMKHVGSFHTDNFRNAMNRNDAFTVFNFEAMYETPAIWDIRFLLRAEVRNLMNTLYFSNGEGNAFFPAAERNYLIGITARI
ncbi:MAG: TonB-dependent receptor [Ignavibacteria bacterium]|nr:TonB-dependent receptor [Ignavibacteria bacterium]